LAEIHICHARFCQERFRVEASRQDQVGCCCLDAGARAMLGFHPRGTLRISTVAGSASVVDLSGGADVDIVSHSGDVEALFSSQEMSGSYRLQAPLGSAVIDEERVRRPYGFPRGVMVQVCARPGRSVAPPSQPARPLASACQQLAHSRARLALGRADTSCAALPQLHDMVRQPGRRRRRRPSRRRADRLHAQTS
jgi:hypothetical protein